jgi:hypothetical protein
LPRGEFKGLFFRKISYVIKKRRSYFDDICIYDLLVIELDKVVDGPMEMKYDSFLCNLIGQGPFSCVIPEGFFTPQFSKATCL